MVFHWRLSDSKSPQVSKTLLSILAVFNNAVLWMVSTQPPTSKTSKSFNNPLVTVPKDYYYYYYYYYYYFFPHQQSLMVFHWSLNDNMVFTRPLISKSSCPYTISLVTLPSVLITIAITVILMFHSLSVL